MARAIQLPYGKRSLEVEIPEANLAWVVSPRMVPGVVDPQGEVRRALQNPIGMGTLEELVREKGTGVVLLVDDMTRSTPQKIILPVLLDALNQAGVPDSSILALICLGTHRAMTDEEISERFGHEAVRRIPFHNHDCRAVDLVEVPNPNSGVPVLVNRLYFESDISIAVGNIIPHMYAGWAGGAKMVQPGVCGEATTGETHFMAAERVHDILGNVNNPVRQEIENVARLTGLTMIVNTVLNPADEIVRVVAGDPILAHREGVRTAETVYRADIEEHCDVVIASAYPSDLDFWQSIKALNNCALAVRPGGTLILLAQDSEGIAEDHPDMIRLGCRTPGEAKRAFQSGEIRDKVALSTYLAMDLNRSRVEVILVTDGIKPDEAARIGLKTAPSPEKALQMAMSRLGDGVRVGLVTHGADIYFRVGNKQVSSGHQSK